MAQLDTPSAAAPGLREPLPGGQRLTAACVRELGRFIYLWAWPMMNVHERRRALDRLAEPGLLGGILPAAPVNELAMLSDRVAWQERAVACPSQEVVPGFGMLDLEREPVVLQVPEFGGRFWVYHVGDMRTESFAELGAMHGSRPGFYLLVGPDWKGEPPAGIAGVFRSPTATAYVVPRVFVRDDAGDKAAAQPLLAQIQMYPLSRFDGAMKTRDWARLPHLPAPAGDEVETRWVAPENFFDVLPAVLDEAPPLHGEEAIYAQARALLEAAKSDPEVAAGLAQAAREAERDLVGPLFEFHNYGVSLPHGWTTIANGAAFGADYVTRTAVAKSNIFVNRPEETKYFYQDFDDTGVRLHGERRFALTFPADGLPPHKGFWSLTVYNKHHFLAPNPLMRFSVGSHSEHLRRNPDGSLTIWVQPADPGEAMRSNWLPAPREEFSLDVRVYWPEAETLDGRWTPPPVRRA